ncbi:MAG: Hsp20/alpha crystallin family protein [Gammaproteobacteria bacterium]
MATQQKTEERSRETQARDQSSSDQGSRSRGESSRGLQRPRGGALSPFAPGLFGLSPFALSPFGLMRKMQEDMERLISETLQPAAQPRAEWTPALETFQRDNEFVIRLETPGLTADDLVVEIGEDAITISGERRDEHEDERGGVFVSEVRYGTFARVVPLPQGALPDNATATFNNGVLEIVVPAPSQETRRGRRIEIGRGEGQRQSQGQGQATAVPADTGQSREQRRS